MSNLFALLLPSAKVRDTYVLFLCSFMLPREVTDKGKGISDE